MSRLPLQALQGFVTAARLGKLSLAAEALNLTVSALSHQVRGLEDRLQQRLFERGPRGIRLTADGQRLFDAVSGPLQSLEHALRPCAGRRDHVLTLSLLPSMASSWLVPRLPDFQARHPEVRVRFVPYRKDEDFSGPTPHAAILTLRKQILHTVLIISMLQCQPGRRLFSHRYIDGRGQLPGIMLGNLCTDITPKFGFRLTRHQ